MITLQARKLIKTFEDDPNVLDQCDPKLIFSPLHRRIVSYAKLLHEHNRQVTKSYIIEAIKQQVKNADPYIKEIEDIHLNDYWLGGDVNTILRTEYNENTFNSIQTVLNNTELQQDQKIQKIDKLITSAGEDHGTVEINEIIDDIIDRIRQPGGEILKRIKLQDKELVAIFGEYLYSSPYVIAGRPGDGKTTLLIHLQTHLNRLGLHGLHFTLEDSKDVFGVKYSCAFNDIQKTSFFNNAIPEQKLETMDKLRPQGKLNVYDRMVDKDDIRRIIKDHKRHFPLDFVTLDYLQLVSTKGEKKHEGLSEYSHMVMEICKDFEVPFIHTAQLNRVNEGQMPVLGNIKDCGSIEQDARYLFAIWNEDGNTDAENRHVAVLKDSTNGIRNLTVHFNFKTGLVRKVYNFSPQNKKNGKYIG
jgi:replicative DNA helicase